MTRRILVTGGAGFIGSHLVDRLLEEHCEVTVLDNFDPFYDPRVKRRNIERQLEMPGYRLIEADIRDEHALETLVRGEFDVVVHLAAKAGVRPSIEDPVAYQDVNVRGTQNLLELCRRRGIRHFVFGSSSSVYGVNPRVPWREEDSVLRPISPYASTKVSGELLGHVYSVLHGIRFVGLRFFTVYGPRQRPDLAIHRFARLMLDHKPLPLFGDGRALRDYTFVSDVVSGIVAAMRYEASPFEIINIGNDDPVTLSTLVAELEKVLGLHARIDRQPVQPGDVPQTWASVDKAAALLNYRPATPLRAGLRVFADWLDREHSRPLAWRAMSLPRPRSDREARLER